jgi:membrane dipeptidase
LRAVLLTLALLAAAPAAQAAPMTIEQARALLRGTPLVDGHNDLPYSLRLRNAADLVAIDIAKDQSALSPPLHTDLIRLRAGGVGAQFWSVYVSADLPPAQQLTAVIEQIDLVKRMTARYPDQLAMAWSAEDVRRVHRSGRTASLIGMEGGAGLNGSLGALRELRRAGVRYITLTHSKTTDWADSATDAPKHDGLSPFGEDVVREMNRQGVLVDLSHVSEAAMEDALRVAQAPVIFSHSSARALTAHPRNVPDGVLAKLKANGGVVMVTFVPGFVSEPVRQWNAAEASERARLASLNPGEPAAVDAGLNAWRAANPAPRARLTDVADHLDHARKVAGIDHVGLGSDFDGIPTTVEGLDSVDDYPALLVELSRRGWSEADLRKLVGENLLRVMEQADRTAARLQAQP